MYGVHLSAKKVVDKRKKVNSKTPRILIEEGMLPKCLERATPPTRSSVPFERSSSMDTRPRLGRCLDTVRLSDTISRPPILGGAGGSRREELVFDARRVRIVRGDGRRPKNTNSKSARGGGRNKGKEKRKSKKKEEKGEVRRV